MAPADRGVRLVDGTRRAASVAPVDRGARGLTRRDAVDDARELHARGGMDGVARRQRRRREHQRHHDQANEQRTGTARGTSSLPVHFDTPDAGYPSRPAPVTRTYVQEATIAGPSSSPPR